MGIFSEYNNELEVLRHTYFYETVCCELEADTILEMMKTDPEMKNIDNFSKWLFSDSCADDSLEHLKAWLTNIGYQDYFDKMFDKKYCELKDE